MDQVARALFQHFDTNGDKTIDVDELRVALAVDTDGDGVISDTVQTRTIVGRAGRTTETTWTERQVLTQAVNAYLANEAKYGNGDNRISESEFLAIFSDS